MATIAPPNKHMLRAGMHKVLGRARLNLVLGLAPRARVPTDQRAGADLGCWAALNQRRTESAGGGVLCTAC
jgi:hypothetical protein